MRICNSTSSVRPWTGFLALALASCGGDPTLAGSGEQGTSSGEAPMVTGESVTSAGPEDTGAMGSTATVDDDPGVCGDGVLQVSSGETCDDSGESATCNDDCTKASCGDLKVNTTAGEACDDGNAYNADSCTNACALPQCGDGTTHAQEGEECDDSGETGNCTDACMLKTWGRAVSLADDERNTFIPKIAMNDAGSAVVVWRARGFSSVGASLDANRYDPLSGTWGEKQLAIDGNQYHGRVALDQLGNAIAFGSLAGVGTLRASFYDGGTDNWDLGPIVNDEQGGVSDIEIGVNAFGNAAVVWRQYNGADWDLYGASYEAQTNTWGSASLLENNNTGDVEEHDVVIDDVGNAIAVWMQNDGEWDSIYFNRYDAAAGVWGSALLIETNDAGFAWDPAVAMHANGDALVLWGQDDDPAPLDYDVNFYSRWYSAATDTWGAPALVKDDTAGVGSPEVVALSNGDAAAIWFQSDAGQWWSLYAARYEAISGTWSPPVLIEDDERELTWVSLAASSNGDTVAVWDVDDDLRSAHAARYDAQSGTWGTPISLGTDREADARRPHVGMDALGNAIVVWVEDHGLFGPPTAVYARHYQ